MMLKSLVEASNVKADAKSRLVYKDFNHGTSINMIKRMNEITGDKFDPEGGVCLGLSFSFLAHRRIKEKFWTAGEEEYTAEQFVNDYEKLFAFYDSSPSVWKNPDPLTAKFFTFRRTMRQDKSSGRDIGSKNARIAHAGVAGAMETQQAYLQGTRAKTQPIFDQMDHLNENAGDYEQKLKDLSDRGLRQIDADWYDLYVVLGSHFLPDLMLDKHWITKRANWCEDDKLSGARFRCAYHLISCEDHALALTTNHARGIFKFFEPNEAIVSAKTFDGLKAIVQPYMAETFTEFSVYTYVA